MSVNQKPLSYYKSLKYPIKIEVDKDGDEEWYIAFSEELGRGACYGLGATPSEALDNFLTEKDDFIELLSKENLPIPEVNKERRKP